MTGNGACYDNQAPTLVSARLEQVNGNAILPEQLFPEDIVTYTFAFDEEVSGGEDMPELMFSLDGAEMSAVTATLGNASGSTMSFTASAIFAPFLR